MNPNKKQLKRLAKKEVKGEEECKAYTQAKGAYASFHSGAKCKRKAVKKGYCLQHFNLKSN